MTNVRDPFVEESDAPSTFQPLVQRLWGFRAAMAIAFVTLAVVIAGAILLAYMLAPKERIGTLSFRLTFEGADQDRFPNGTPFNSSEIVAAPVLTEVFRMNELERYMPFSTFKESMFVLQANPNLDMLSSEYQSKLADPKLSPVDRSRLEEEFQKKRESLRSAQYALNFQRSERSVTMPSTVMAKVLTDTITTWSRQAVEFKGALRDDLPLLSKNAMKKEFLDAEDYVIAVDILRSKAEQILANIQAYSRIPGAGAVRLGEEQLSLADVRTQVEDILRFRIEPLFGQIRANGGSKDPAGIASYFEGRFFRAQLERDEAAARVKSLQVALADYLQKRSTPADTAAGAAPFERGGSVMPQLSESFIDRIVEMATDPGDREFRQDLIKRIISESGTLAQLARQAQYYDGMRKSFAAGRTAGGGAATDVKAATDRAFNDLATTLDRLGQLYGRIAEQHLNPSGILYTVTSPFVVRTTAALSPNTALRYFMGLAFLALLLIPFAFLAYAYVRESVAYRTPVRPKNAVPRG